MLQTITAEDARWTVSIEFDTPNIMPFYAGQFTGLLSELLSFNQVAPVAELDHNHAGPGGHRLTVDLKDGRRARYEFFNEAMTLYTLRIDGSAPWMESETLRLPAIRLACANLHVNQGVHAFKVVFK